jgi:mRNA interferase HigB
LLQGLHGAIAPLWALFPAADRVGDRHVFNVGGNKSRVIVALSFHAQCACVKAVLTHADYDRGHRK